MAAPIPAQETGGATPPVPAAPADPVLEALERQKKIAELEQAIAEAEKARLAAKLPTTKGSGNAGEVTFGEGSGYYAEILAYRAMTEVAQKLAADIGKPGADDEKILVVADENFVKSAPLWEIAKNRIEDATNKVADLLQQYPPDHDFRNQEAVAAVLTTATAILGAAADIASFFRSELEVTARTANVTATSLVAATAASLKLKGWRPVLPLSSVAKPTLLEKVETLQQSRRDLAQRRHKLEASVQPALKKLAELNLELAEATEALKTARAATPPVAGTIGAAEQRVRGLQVQLLPFGTTKGRWDKAAAEIDATVAATDVLIKALLEAPDGKMSPIETVTAIDRAKSDPNLRILRLEISSQGGEMHVSKSVWSTRLTYVGGVAVSYLLTDQAGEVQKSAVFALPVAQSTGVRGAASALAIEARSEVKP